MQNPNESHWEALQRVFSYLKGSMQRGFTYRRSAGGLIGYTDADWAGDRDTRKSTSGYVFLMQGAPISWRSKRQECVALSTAEAEYIAATEATKESLFLKGIINTFLPIGRQLRTITIKGDNESCIRIRRNPEFHQRMKYIDLRYHFIRNHINNGDITLEWTPGANQLADGLTKSLPQTAFDTFVRKIGLTDGSPSE